MVLEDRKEQQHREGLEREANSGELLALCTAGPQGTRRGYKETKLNIKEKQDDK